MNNENEPILIQVGHSAEAVKKATGRNAIQERENRLAILKRNQEFIEHHAQTATKDTVYLILEQHSKYAANDEMKQWILECKDNHVIPSVLFCVPRWQAYKMLRKVQQAFHRESNGRDPAVSEAVELLKNEAVKDTVWVAIIACNGKQIVQLPIPPITQEVSI